VSYLPLKKAVKLIKKSINGTRRMPGLNSTWLELENESLMHRRTGTSLPERQQKILEKLRQRRLKQLGVRKPSDYMDPKNKVHYPLH
jgi:hypothetical protein